MADSAPEAKTQTRWVQTAVPQKPAEGGYPVPKLSDFKAVVEPVPTEADLADGEVLVRNHFLSPDPYIVSMIMANEANVGKTVWAGAAGEVVISKSDALAVGDLVVGGGSSGSQEYFRSQASKVNKFPGDAATLSASLGVCGMPGVTAYLATRDILGADLTGKTVVVTGAAGAVGSAAVQIAKLLGAAKVVGLAGQDSKCKHVVEKFGVDHMLNYKSGTLAADLKALAPFHAFYDNTGGPAAKLIKALLVDAAPVAKVGSIGGDSTTEDDKRLKQQGFYAGGIVDQWPAAIGQLVKWVGAGKIKFDETRVKGIESVPQAFINQRLGKQLGKMIVDLREEAK